MKQLSCSDFKLLADDFGDLERMPPEAYRHSEGCADCARFARELAALRALLREPARVTAPPDFDARLARALRERDGQREPGRSRGWAFSAQMAAAAASVVLAVGAVFFVGLPGGGDTEPDHAPVTVATNTNTALGNSGAPLPPTDLAVPDVAAEVSVDVPTLRVSSGRSTPVSRPRRMAREAREATIVLGDAAGVRVVSVPTIIVGAQEILPSSDDEPASGRISL